MEKGSLSLKIHLSSRAILSAKEIKIFDTKIQVSYNKNIASPKAPKETEKFMEAKLYLSKNNKRKRDSMIDFENGLMKLRKVNENSVVQEISPLFTEGEELVSCYKGIRDHVIFTNKRIITVNIQGVTGKKRDFTSLPYSKIHAFSIETSGVIDMDSELELWFTGLGKITLEFLGSNDILKIGKIIGNYVL